MLFGILFRKNIRSLDDQELLTLIRKDNDSATGELFERYRYLVMGVCLKYLKNSMESEDMLMKIFQALPDKIKKNEVQNFRSWLHSVTRNECLMNLRKKNPETGDADHALVYQEDDSYAALKLAHLNERKINKLEEAINELKDEQQRCIREFYLNGKSYEEVSQILGYDMNKVKSAIQNGKRNLKNILENFEEFKEQAL